MRGNGPRPLGRHGSASTAKASLREDIAVAVRFFKLAHRLNRRFIPVQLVSAIINALRTFPAVIMPKFIIDELMGEQRPAYFVLYVAIYLLSTALLDQGIRFFNTRTSIAVMHMTHLFEAHLGERNLTMCFEAMEDPEILDLKQKALRPIEEDHALENMIYYSLRLLQNVITLLGLLSILFTLDWVLIAALLILVLINTLFSRRRQNIEVEANQMLAVIDRQWDYYRNLSTDFSMGKDVRLYNMEPMLMSKIRAYHKSATSILSRVCRLFFSCNVPSGLITALQTGLTYAYVVWKTLLGAITLGDFSMYVSAATQFSTAILAFFESVVLVRTNCRYMDAYLRYAELPLTQESGDRSPDEVSDLTIEFRHVWFRYPRSEHDVLRDVSLTIHPGEKLSVVGRNGAGKSTFIKLLCRLYEPTEGQILLGGVDIHEFDYDEYMKLLAVVFQDYKLFAFTVKENIAFDKADETDDETVMAALTQAGVGEAMAALKKGIYTPLYKAYDEDGMDLSGGQSQKLAIARAVFKHAPIVVLDEPTAALDPFAEAEIYTRFHELVEANTAIYISHRLSSCRFCDHIAVFDHGALIEYGTHEQLLSQNGAYTTLFNAQAQYYQ